MKTIRRSVSACKMALLYLFCTGAVLADVASPEQAAVEAQLMRGAYQWNDKKRPDLAQELIAKVLAMNPYSPPALAFQAESLLRENKLTEANKILDVLKLRHPQHTATRELQELVRVYGQDRELLVRMRLLARAGRTAEAATIAVQLFPNGPPSLGGLGVEYYQILAAAPKARKDSIQSMDRLYRETGDSRYRLSQLELKISQGDSITSVLRELAKLSNQPDIDKRVVTDMWRRALNQLGDTPSNTGWVRAFLAEVPNDPDMTKRLAVMQLAQQRAEQLARDPVNIARLRARKAMAQDQHDQAEEQWQLVLEQRPNDGESLGNLGLIRLREGRHDEAQDFFKQAYQFDSQQKWQSLQQTARFWGLLQQAGTAVQEKNLVVAEEYINQALAMDSQQIDAIVALARVYVLQDRPDQAQAQFEKALRLAPNNKNALRELAILHVKAGRPESAQKLLSKADQPDPYLVQELSDIRAELLREQARTHLAAQQFSSALPLLEAAVLITPDNPWLRHELARLYLKMDLPGDARSVMREGVTLAPTNFEMRYASALISSALNDDVGALADLQQIPFDERSDSMNDLVQRASVNVLITQSIAVDGASTSDVTHLLQSAETLAANQTELLYSIANAWFRLDQPEQGIAVFDRLATRQANLPAQAQLLHAQLRNRGRDDTALAGQLPALLALSGLTPEQESQRLEIYTDHQERVISRLVFAGQQTEALQLAEQALPSQTTQTHPPIAAQRQKAQARLLLAAGAQEPAIAMLQSALQELPDDLDLRLDLGNALYKNGQVELALTQARWLQTNIPESDLNRRLALLRLFQRTGSLEIARDESQRLLEQLPDDVDVLLHAARLQRSMGQYATALAYFQQARQRELATLTGASKNKIAISGGTQIANEPETLPLRLAYSLKAFKASSRTVTRVLSDSPPNDFTTTDPMRLRVSLATGSASAGEAASTRALAVPKTNSTLAGIDDSIQAIEARRQAWLEVGHEVLQNPGTDGISSLRGAEQTIVAWMPWDYNGHLFLHLDPVRLDAGQLPAQAVDAQRFGQVAARAPTDYAPNLYRQKTSGFNIGVGYEGDSLRWDIGQIGVGFPVSNLVGGVSTNSQWSRFNYSLGFSRRPITGSLLSYAGTTDPSSGGVWGGVVATGVNARLATDFGPYSFSTSAAYSVLNGRNVMDNTRLQWRAALDRDVLRSSSQAVNLGLSVSLLRHAHDLSEYTWGHGGYYSPGRSVSLSLPLQWSGREGLLTWRVRGAISASNSASDAIDRFPTQAALQAAAGNPVYGASSSTGIGKSLSGVVEYQVKPQWAVGARYERDLSEDYAPLNVLLYLRYLFDPVVAPAPERPRPPQAYSKF